MQVFNVTWLVHNNYTQSGYVGNSRAYTPCVHLTHIREPLCSCLKVRLARAIAAPYLARIAEISARVATM